MKCITLSSGKQVCFDSIPKAQSGLKATGSRFNIPLSKEEQLMQQARAQGDMPVAPGVVKAKEKIREQEAVKKKLSKQPTVKLSTAQKKAIDAQGLKQDVLAEMMLRNQQSLANPDDRSIEADIAQDLNENGALGLLDAPIKGATAFVTGRYQTPSQAIGRWANQNNHQMLRNAMIDDQFNPTGLGMVTDWGGPIGLEMAASKTIQAAPGLVKNAYKINPWAYKTNPNAYYRGIGKSGFDDALESGVIRPPEGSFYNDLYMSPDMNIAKDYSRNKPNWRWQEVESNVPGQAPELKQVFDPVDETSYLVEIPKGSVPNVWNTNKLVSTTTDQIPTDQVKLLKEHWLQGYKPIKVPKSNTPEEMVTLYRVEPKNATFPSDPLDSEYLDHIYGTKEDLFNKSNFPDGEEILNKPTTKMYINEGDRYNSFWPEGSELYGNFYPQHAAGNFWTTAHPSKDFMAVGAMPSKSNVILKTEIPKSKLKNFHVSNDPAASVFGNRENEYILPSEYRNNATIKPFLRKSEFDNLINNLKDWIPRRQFIKNLQKEGLIRKEFNIDDLNYTARSKERTEALTKLALDRAATRYRGVKGSVPYNGKGEGEMGSFDMSRPAAFNKISEFENMRIAGVDFNDPLSIAKYQASHVPMERYGYRSGMPNLPYIDALYSTRGPSTAGPSGYGNYQIKLTSPRDYSEGSYGDWFKRYHNPDNNFGKLGVKDGYYINDFIPDVPYETPMGLSKTDLVTVVGKKGQKMFDVDETFPFMDKRNLSEKQEKEFKKYIEDLTNDYNTGWRGKYQKGGRNSFNFPISKERQLAEQARQQGDIAAQNKVLPKEAVKANAIAKEKIKQQQERKAQEDFYNKGRTELNEGKADIRTAVERKLDNLNLGFDQLEQQGNLAPGFRDFQNMGALDKGLFLMGSAFEPMGAGKPEIVMDHLNSVNSNTVRNLKDLQFAQKFAEQYGYELPTNLERISQSDMLTNRTIRGMMDRHNTFVRGVSTNWDELGKRNPEILRHLESKGFDLSTKEGTKAAAEYMATHIPINTGYGRASLNQDVFNKGLDALYTSNSIPTAEGYTYGQGFITKVKKPTDFSSINRQNWITKNNPEYYDDFLPGSNKIIIDGNLVNPVNLQLPFNVDVRSFDNINNLKNKILDDLKKYATNLKEASDKTTSSNPNYSKNMKDSYEEVMKQISDIKTQKWEKFNLKFDKSILKTEHHKGRFGDSFGSILGLNGEEVVSKLSSSADEKLNHIKNLTTLTKEVGARNNKKIADLTDEYLDLVAKGEENIISSEKARLDFLEKEIQNLRINNLDETRKVHIDYLNNNFPNWQNRKDDFAHYIHLGTPGEKVLTPIKSWEITPEIWKNKSRGHSNRYSKKLSKLEVGGKNINTTGYLDNSDTKHNPYNIIPSNNITMDGVSIPLMLMPDGDQARVVMPNSGEYNFPNSQYVTEIPLAQKGTKVAKVAPPIYTSDPNDPRLRSYNDSSNLYKAYEFQKQNYKPGYEAWLKDVGKNYPGGVEALRKEREKNIGEPLSKQFFSKDDKKSEFKSNVPDSQYDHLYPEENPIINYYKSLIKNDKDYRIGMHSSPDLWHKNINPIGSYYDGARSPIYKKPVQPVIYNPIERTTLDQLESRTVPMLESNFESTPMSVDRPMMQPSNEEYNRQYSITIPTVEINKRQVAPRVNRVLGQNRVNPKNQYQRSIDVDTRQLPIIDEYTLNKLRMKLGMEPKGFQTGGQAVKKDNGKYNMQRAIELGYEPDETGHWPSVDYTNGMWLKSKDHPTAWMEYLYGHTLNPELNRTTNVVVNPQGHFGNNQLQYIPKKQRGGKTLPPDFNKKVSQRDSVANMAFNTFTWEGNAGSATGGPLSDFGYHDSQEPVSRRPVDFTPPTNQKEAVDLYMKEIAPKVSYLPTAMEQASAGDFLLNTGRDPRVYMLDQYLKSTGQAGLPNRGSYNVDTKTEAWTPALQQSLDAEWNKYKNNIYKLTEQQRRVLLNKGRDFYYKNTYTGEPGDGSEGVTNWGFDQNGNPIRGKDGSLSPAYGKTWYGRQHASDQYQYVDPKVVNDKSSKFYPKKQSGGKNENQKEYTLEGVNISGDKLDKYGFFDWLKTNLNPYNWGVDDYSEYKTRNEAYEAAKRAGKEEFMYNHKRFNTEYDGTPGQEIMTYGINGKPVIFQDDPAQVNVYPMFSDRYLPGHIAASITNDPDAASIDYSSYGNNPLGLVNNKTEKDIYYVYGIDKDKFYNKASSLPSGGYMLEDKYTPSDWNLFTNNCADNVCDAFGIPRSKGLQTPSGAISKIKETYPTLNVTGRTKQDYLNKLSSKKYDDIIKQADYIKGLMSSPEAKEDPGFRKDLKNILDYAYTQSNYYADLENTKALNKEYEKRYGEKEIKLSSGKIINLK